MLRTISFNGHRCHRKPIKETRLVYSICNVSSPTAMRSRRRGAVEEISKSFKAFVLEITESISKSFRKQTVEKWIDGGTKVVAAACIHEN